MERGLRGFYISRTTQGRFVAYRLPPLPTIANYLNGYLSELPLQYLSPIGVMTTEPSFFETLGEIEDTANQASLNL